MIDLHTHLLPAVDDGSRTLETSVRVLERLVLEGVREVACTPHLRATAAHEAPVAAHAALRRQLQAAAPAGVQLVAGFEIMLDRPGCDLRLPGLTLGDSHAMLVEFPRAGLPPGSTEELLRIRSGGRIPVVAHPERYRGVSVDLVHQWREVGVIIQGDAQMLLATGTMATLAREMLAEGVYDILASDNHGDRRSLATVRLWLDEMGGEEQGRLLTDENPRRVLADIELEPVSPLRQGRTLWQRLRALMGSR